MKLKRSTQGLLLAALLLGAGVAIYEGTIAPERRTQRDRDADLLAIAAADIETIEIETPRHSLRFERLAEPAQIELEGGDNEFAIAEWEFVRLAASAADSVSESEDGGTEDGEPDESESGESESGAGEPESETDSGATPARQAYMDYLFGAIERAGSERTIARPVADLAEYGLDDPPLRLTLELADGTRHVLELGDRDFSQSFVYGILDRAEDADEVEILLLSPDLINAIDRDLADWDATAAIDSDLDLPDPDLEPAPEASDEPDEPGVLDDTGDETIDPVVPSPNRE